MNKGDTEYRQLILQMALEAGFEELFKDSHDWVCFTEDIERFFQLATEWEREQCTKVGCGPA